MGMLSNRALELIICRDHHQMRRVLRSTERHTHIKVITPSVRAISGVTPQRITVMPGVELYEDLEGEGPLGRVLEQRQQTWGPEAVFLDFSGE